MNKPGNNLLWKYAGLAAQFIAGIGLALYAGLKLDEWLKIKMPLAVWVLPLLLILGVIFKVVIDTASKK